MIDRPKIVPLPNGMPRPIPPRKPRHGALVLSTRFFISITAELVTGLRRLDPEEAHFILPTDAVDLDLGRHVRAALVASRYFHPTDPGFTALPGLKDPIRAEAYERHMAGLLALAGVKTKRAFYNGARHVFLDLCEGTITVGPSVTRADGSSYCHADTKGMHDFTLPALSPDEALGRAVREALAMSR